MKEIKDYELQYPQLRLITNQHKIKYVRALNNNNRNEMIINCDLVIDEIIKDIKFDGDRYFLITILSYMVVNDLSKLISDLKI